MTQRSTYNRQDLGLNIVVSVATDKILSWNKKRKTNAQNDNFRADPSMVNTVANVISPYTITWSKLRGNFEYLYLYNL